MDFSSPVSALNTLLRRQRISELTRREIECLRLCLEKQENQDNHHHDSSPSHWGVNEIAALDHLLLHRRWDVQAAALVIAESHFATILKTLPSSTLRLVFDLACRQLEHQEPRLRHLIARVLGQASVFLGVSVYIEFQSQLLDSIEANFNRSSGFVEELVEKFMAQEAEEESREKDESKPTGTSTLTASLIAKLELEQESSESAHHSFAQPFEYPSPPLSPRSNLSTTSTIALDDTSGWKALETSLFCLTQIIRGCGPSFLSQGHFSPKLANLIFSRSTQHINRHVRAVAFDAITAICEIATPVEMMDFGLHSGIDLEQDRDQDQARTSKDSKVSILLAALSKGLQDNWSQVRFAASIATRKFLMTLNTLDNQQLFFPQLLPRLCLNRYYLAEGVKLYSQETWAMIFKCDLGKPMVAKYCPLVAQYYISVADEHNHVVREAACHCIAELATKVEKAAVSPFVSELLQALIMCFEDESWPVRDAACVATGQFVLGFPEASRPHLDQLYPMWIGHLSDNVWSVREDAAIALGNVLRAYGQEALEIILPHLSDFLGRASSQPSMTQREYLDQVQDTARHTDTERFSCGSLAPKLRKHKGGGGCGDCKIFRHREPWEYTQGAIYLVREICAVFPELGVKYFDSLAQIALLRHFPQTSNLQETLWKELPAMASLVTKKVFKQYLELFLDPLVFSIQHSQSRLTAFAAKECVGKLSLIIGPRIFQGRLEAREHWQVNLSTFATSVPGPAASTTLP